MSESVSERVRPLRSHFFVFSRHRSLQRRAPSLPSATSRVNPEPPPEAEADQPDAKPGFMESFSLGLLRRESSQEEGRRLRER